MGQQQSSSDGSWSAPDVVLSWRDIRKHDGEHSCWIVVNGLVYDLTDFIHQHPGGADVFLEHAGKDGTKDYKTVYAHEEADNLEQLRCRCIGRCDNLDLEDMHEEDILHASNAFQSSRSMEHGSGVVLYIFMAIALMAYLIHYAVQYTHSK